MKQQFNRRDYIAMLEKYWSLYSLTREKFFIFISHSVIEFIIFFTAWIKWKTDDRKYKFCLWLFCACSFIQFKMYLSPDKVDIIPVSQVTAGYKNQKLVVNFHEFPVKNSNRKVCFLFSHSNGFHKESFHPLMSRFIKYLRSLKEYEKTSITFVSWDARNHGDSARLNEGTFLPSCNFNH